MKIYENGICREMTEEEIAKYNVSLPPEFKIEKLKQSLADTNDNILKVVEGETTLLKCAEIIAKRRAWRKEINELEAKLAEGGE